jgi:hypothetical protein
MGLHGLLPYLSTSNNRGTAGSGVLYAAVTSYSGDQRGKLRNTSIIALRVVGGDEKGPQCLGVYTGHPIPGGYIRGPGPPGWSLESETVKCGVGSRGNRT